MTSPPSGDREHCVRERLEVLRGTDAEAHAALLDVLSGMGERYGSPETIQALSDLLTRVAIETSPGALALIARLGTAALDVDLGTLRRWAFFGLQHYHGDPQARQRHFEFDDPHAFTIASPDPGEQAPADRRAALVHYFAGFGLPGLRVDLHPPAAPLGPPQRATVSAELILLPRRTGAGTGPPDFLLQRAMAAHAIAHLRFSVRARLAGNRQPMLLALLGLIEDARVERLMGQLYPGLVELWGRFHVATRAGAGFAFAGLAARLARALHDPAYVDGNPWVEKGRQLFNAALDPAAYDQVARLLAVDVEKMRLPFSNRLYQVEPPYRDDNALLWNFSAALPEDELRARIREDFEFKPQPTPPAPLRHVEVDARRRTRYPEWDCKVGMLHENWTTVIDDVPHLPIPGAGAPTPPPFARHVRLSGRARIPDRSLRRERLEEGDELDLDAAVACVVQHRARRAPDRRVFRRHGRRRASAAVLLLMDLSESTNRFIPGSFVTVLEAEKHAALVVADAVDPAHDRLAVHGFASDGRTLVNYLHVKDFDQPLGSAQRARLAALSGGLSTRMGAALRHATSFIVREHAERKLILLLTDGEPSDVDVDEGDYLREDARHAVIAAASCGVRTFCLTLDRRADPYVQRIFGARNYLINDHAHDFTRQAEEALVKFISQ